MRTPDEVMALYPDLNGNGFGHEYAYSLIDPQIALEVAEWMAENLPKGACRYSSYGLKHLVEHLVRGYVANGEAIMAAAMLDYPITRDRINAIIKVDGRALRRLQRENGMITR